MLITVRELLIAQTTVVTLSKVKLARLAETWREPSDGDMIVVDVMCLINIHGLRIRVRHQHAVRTIIGRSPLFNDKGVVHHDNWQRVSCSFRDGGAGNTLSSTIAALLVFWACESDELDSALPPHTLIIFSFA